MGPDPLKEDHSGLLPVIHQLEGDDPEGPGRGDVLGVSMTEVARQLGISVSTASVGVTKGQTT